MMGVEAMSTKKTGGKGASTKKLLIVESPAKIKTISKFLGPDFKIMSTFGHVRDLPERKIGVEVDDKFSNLKIDYVTIKGKESTVADICKSAVRSGEVYLASDPDREGEVISWHIGEEIKKAGHDAETIYRISFNEITKSAVQAAIQNKSVVNMDQVSAQQARRVLDRWVGYEVSPILWKKISKGLSAGRVQSVALLLVCQREDAIIAFVPVESWSVHGLFGIASVDLNAELWKVKNKLAKLKDKKAADAVLAAIKELDFSIADIIDKERAKKPLPPFMTSSLQQDAYNKYGYPVDRTMRIAQTLYEGIKLGGKDPEALITYMRTDSLRIADEALKSVRSFVKDSYGKEYCTAKSVAYSKKGAQDAHEAIRPVDVSRTPEYVSKFIGKDEAKIYELIWRRFVACQMAAAKFAQRQIHLKGGDYLFKASGSTLIFDGFLKVYRPEEDEKDEKEAKLPDTLKKGDDSKLKKAEGKQHFTKPPARFSEATLVKEMEKLGIGRPSTYSATLSVIQKRTYVEKDNKRFVPTELGRAVSSLLSEHLPDIINVQFTALMEADLDKISQGDASRDDVLLTFYKKFKKDLEKFGAIEGGRAQIPTDIDCKACGKQKLVIRFGRAGEFLGCPGYPECSFTSNFTRDEDNNIELVKAEAPVELKEKCPKCGKSLVQKNGRFGPFVACPGYPDCKYVHAETLKMKCPACQGLIKKRVWKKGVIWGCENYPTCKFGIFGDVVETPCPKCKKPYLMINTARNGQVSHACPEKECGYKVAVETPEESE